ncbi:hypothetical protein [Armatimonas rosea]|uniref:Uncharacterized protein n=1 Tax=Armatimonas rosea TaxID=685828 RepID=A0A7W9SUU0_ARMRO|nr:hypothetical protein [Armatimonas rosea]MBB6052453.1 hypothetical protein [Armatimonas rosea]
MKISFKRTSIVALVLFLVVSAVASWPMTSSYYRRFQYYQMGRLYGERYKENESIVAGIERREEDPGMLFLILQVPDDENKSWLRERFDAFLFLDRPTQNELITDFVHGFRATRPK